MSSWNDYPQWHKGYFWMLAPTAVWQATVDKSTSLADGKLAGEDIVIKVYVTSITGGSLGDALEGMTLSVGAAALGWERGYCRVRGTGTDGSGDYVSVWINGASTHAGDLNLVYGSTLYATVWEDYRAWSIPPFYDDSGNGYFDGTLLPAAGYNHDYWPMANGGPPVMGWVAPTTGVLTVTFDASLSYRVDRDAALGTAWGANLSSTATWTADSGTPANVADGSTATYWQPTTPASAWIQAALPADAFVYRYVFTASGAFAPEQWTQTIEDAERDDGYPKWAGTLDEQTGWGTNEARSFVLRVDHRNEDWGTTFNGTGHTTYKWSFENWNGATGRIEEIALYAEDRTNAYTWDFGDGTVTVGTTASEAPTVTFPPGFRYIHLTVEDLNGTTRTHHIPVVALSSGALLEIDKTGATYDASAAELGFAASKAFDDDNATSWRTTATGTDWLSITYAGSTEVHGYSVVPGSITAGPLDWQFQRYNSGAWTAVDTQSGITWNTATHERTFALSAAATDTAFRIYITANNGDPADVQCAELNLFGSEYSDTYSPVSGVEIVQLSNRAGEGQALDVVFHSDISSYPLGTLVMYTEDEYFAGVKGACDEAAHPLSTGPHPKFWGWLDTEEDEVASPPEGTLRSDRARCLDLWGRLRQLPVWNIVAQRQSAPTYGYDFQAMDQERGMFIALRQLSNADTLADIHWAGLIDAHTREIMALNAGSIADMAQEAATAFDCVLTCNRFGSLRFRRDQNLLDEAFRDTAVHVALTEGDYTDLRYTTQRHPSAHWYWWGGVWTTRYWDYTHVDFTLETHFTVAPGQVPVQGVTTTTINEHSIDTIQNQTHVDAAAANAFDNRHTPLTRNVSLMLGPSNDIGLDPGDIPIFTMAKSAGPRGEVWTAKKFYPIALLTSYNHEAMSKTVTVEAEAWNVAPYNALEYLAQNTYDWFIVYDFSVDEQNWVDPGLSIAYDPGVGWMSQDFAGYDLYMKWNTGSDTYAAPVKRGTITYLRVTYNFPVVITPFGGVISTDIGGTVSNIATGLTDWTGASTYTWTGTHPYVWGSTSNATMEIFISYTDTANNPGWVTKVEVGGTGDRVLKLPP